MATISTELAEFVGNELDIARGDYEIPEGYRLPSEISLCSAHVRSNRGIYLGRRWYLQSDYKNDGDVDFVHTDEIHESGEIMHEFLTHHGYVEVDYFRYRRVRIGDEGTIISRQSGVEG